MLDRGRTGGHAQVPYLRNVNVQWGTIDTSDLLTMELADEDRERFGVQRGDLLVCEGGEVGRCAIWRGSDTYVAYQKALHRIRCRPGLTAPFLRYQLQHLAATGDLARLSTGSTIAHLPQQQLRRVRLALPSEEEQRRIVDILEDHLSRLDAAAHAMTTAQQRAKNLIKATEFRAVRDAEDNPAIESRRLSEISRIGTGATPLRGTAGYWEGGTIPWITSGDLSQGLITSASQFVTQEALDKTSIKLWPAGTLLVAMYGEGKTRGTVGELAISATTNQACAAILLDQPTEIRRAWLRLVLSARYESMRRASSGGVQPNLNLGVFRDMQVPWPNENAAAAELASYREITSSVLRLTESVGPQQIRGKSLRRAVLAAAFSGKLTGRRTDDEHIEELAEAMG